MTGRYAYLSENVQCMPKKARHEEAMMHVSINFLRALALMSVLIGAAIWVAVPAQAQSASLAMLGTLVKGEWTIKQRGGAPDRKICIRSGAELIQLRHRDPGCSQFVVEDGASRVTVQYTCPGNGYGRTSIRRETGSLIQVESQGIFEGMPFQLAGEARRTGSC